MSVPSSSSEPNASASAVRPVDLALLAHHLVAGVELLGQLGVDVEVLGPAAERVVDAVERRPGRRRSRPGAGTPTGGGGSAALRLDGGADWRVSSRACCSLRLEVVERLLGLLERELAPLDQRLGEQLAHRAPLVDLGVHQRLGVAGVVALVVAVAAVADEVDDHVLVEPLPVGVGQPGHPHARLGVVAVHVEDRRLDDLGHVGRVEARPGGLGRGREPDLVVDHDVDGAADPVALDVAHVERLGHHALAGEGGVAVHEDRQHREGVGVVDLVLLGPDHALDHRVDRLEVAGVGGQLDRRCSLPARLWNLPTWPRWYFTSPEPWTAVGVERALELLEHLVVVLADDVGQHVEPAAVGHAHDRAVEVARRPRPRGWRRGWGSGSRRPRCRTASGRSTWCRGTSRTPRRR